MSSNVESKAAVLFAEEGSCYIAARWDKLADRGRVITVSPAISVDLRQRADDGQVTISVTGGRLMRWAARLLHDHPFIPIVGITHTFRDKLVVDISDKLRAEQTGHASQSALYVTYIKSRSLRPR